MNVSQMYYFLVSLKLGTYDGVQNTPLVRKCKFWRHGNCLVILWL